MRIAFASCMCNRVLENQPVWDWIASQKPHQLVLLGDSLYLDLNLQPLSHPEKMNDDDFAKHLFALYGELMAQPQFASLVRAMPPGTVKAIWDDHDFLWNDAMGAEVRVLHGGKVRRTTAFHEAFRRSAAAGFAPGSFPANYRDPVFWNEQQPDLATPSIQLADRVWLHLSDGRTHRTRTWMLEETKRTLLGPVQRSVVEAAVRSAPDAIHLFASGSTIAGYQRHPVDLEWLKNLAATHRVLVLSGDIHRNALDYFETTGWRLHEATSSGAGVKDAVVVGGARANFGLLDIDDDTLELTIRLFTDNQVPAQHTRVLDYQTWLPRLPVAVQGDAA